MSVTLHVQHQEPLSMEKFAAFIARQFQRLDDVYSLVFIEIRRGRETEIALVKAALELARNRVQG